MLIVCAKQDMSVVETAGSHAIFDEGNYYSRSKKHETFTYVFPRHTKHGKLLLLYTTVTQGPMVGLKY